MFRQRRSAQLCILGNRKFVLGMESKWSTIGKGDVVGFRGSTLDFQSTPTVQFVIE